MGDADVGHLKSSGWLFSLNMGQMWIGEFNNAYYPVLLALVNVAKSFILFIGKSLMTNMCNNEPYSRVAYLCLGTVKWTVQ